jgi:hypothetical protein
MPAPNEYSPYAGDWSAGAFAPPGVIWVGDIPLDRAYGLVDQGWTVVGEPLPTLAGEASGGGSLGPPPTPGQPQGPDTPTPPTGADPAGPVVPQPSGQGPPDPTATSDPSRYTVPGAIAASTGGWGRVARELAGIKKRRKPKTDAQLGKALAKRLGGKIGKKIAGPIGRVILGGAAAGGVGAIFSGIWEAVSPGELGDGTVPPAEKKAAPAPIPRRVPRPYFPSREPMDKRTPEQMPPGSARRERIDQIDRQLPPIEVPKTMPRRPLDPFDEALKRERIGDPDRPDRPPPPPPVWGPPFSEPVPKAARFPRARKIGRKFQAARKAVKAAEASGLGVLIAGLRRRRGGSPVSVVAAAVLDPTPAGGSPDLTRVETPSVSSQTSAFVGGYGRTSSASSRCSCSTKKRGKPRKCLERGTVYWKTGRRKGQSAGQKCIRFAPR